MASRVWNWSSITPVPDSSTTGMKGSMEASNDETCSQLEDTSSATALNAVENSLELPMNLVAGTERRQDTREASPVVLAHPTASAI